MKKYVTGIRFLKGFDLYQNSEINRVDFLLCKILKEEPETVTVLPGDQFHFSFDPESITPKQIAHCLRSLAYKIQQLEK
jgi:hypothetical protein